MPHEKTRREFLITTGTGVVAGLISAKAGRAKKRYKSKSEQIRIRKNVVSDDAKSDLDSLRVGVGAMKELAISDPADPRGWIPQAFIHGDCQNFNDCQHGNWFFLPWHRSYLYYFEQLIQHFSGNAGFALPYWDWSRTHGVPASFYGAGNPLADTISVRSQCGANAPTAGRGRTVQDMFSQEDLDTYVGTSVVNDIQQNPDFATYGGSDFGGGELEGTPHNFIHRWVGGQKLSNMVQTFSPLDPIFWLHHCNIDRLYSNWLKRPEHYPPSPSEWTSRSFNDFYDAAGDQVGSQLTCGLTVDSSALGYTYDQTLLLPQRLMSRRRGTPKPRVVASILASDARTAAGVLSFTATAPQLSTLRLMNASAAGARRYVVRLRLENIKTPELQNTGVQVFLGDGITAETPITAPGYVGSFTFFRGHGEGNHGTESAHSHGKFGTLLLNANEALCNLHGDTSLPEGQPLRVSLVTRPLFKGVDAHAEVSEIRPDKVHFDVVDLDG